MLTETVSPTENTIRKIIREQKFIRVDEFFNIASILTKDSYYKNKMPLGANGDFITAPEVSQMFGEIIAVYICDIWQRRFQASKINLVEFGPGRGLLIADILRATQNIPNFHTSIDIYLVDINPHLQELQKERLAKFKIKNIFFISNISEIPEKSSILIANEFFDCFGPRQFIRNDNIWYENVIKTDKNDDFYFDSIILDDSNIIARLAEYKNIQSGSIIEINFAAEDLLTSFLDYMAQEIVAGIIIDYGYFLPPRLRLSSSYKSSLQAMQNHKFCTIFDDIGNADLTSHIDFFALKKLLAKKDYSVEVNSQKDFLLKFGIEIRHRQLVRLNPEKAEELNWQFDFLINKMGELFKLLVFKA
jgi:SAM-dependent MidA family methyltransferase